LHLGNYFGAVEPCLRIQDDPGVELSVFLANYHALTTVHDREELQRNSWVLAESLLALGLDPERTEVFVQSEVPAVTELALLLSMATGMGLLQRAHSYKDKVAHGIVPNVGLFFYPVLMAADILAQEVDVVPVGRDQIQHVEMARDMAVRFNEEFEPVLKLPEADVGEAPKVPGIDGRKMSKSYGNTISPFSEGDDLRDTVARIKTSSTPFGEPLPTEGCPLFALLELVLEDVEEVHGFFRTGRRGSQKFGYGHAKEVLVEAIEERFSEARERRKGIDPEDVRMALWKGATMPKIRAQGTLDRCREACGLRIKKFTKGV
jgi:tryptophanyl-tRNA synthetase